MSGPMICAKCGTANYEGATFCIGCGTDLPRVQGAPAAATTPGSAAAESGAAGQSGQSGPASSAGPGAESPWPESPPAWNPPPPPGYGQPGGNPYGAPGPNPYQGGYGQPPPPPQYQTYGYQAPQGYAPYYGGGPKVNNYMPLAIVSLVIGVLACGIFGVPGIVSVVFASQVGTKVAAGDMNGAIRSSRMAKVWAIVGLAIIGVLFVALVALAFIGAATSNTSDSGTF